MTTKKALFWTLFWVFNAVCFNLGIYIIDGPERASQFTNVYLVEKLLSFDNLFVFLLIFTHFNVPEDQRRKVLNYGLAGAFILRGIAIVCGVEIVQQFNWILYILGAVLLYSAWGVAFSDEEEDNIGESRIIKFAQSFSVKPLIIWIIAVELSDLVFAVDSIPAALSISQDLFVVYTANIFAILGLRSFYFLIQAVYSYLPQLKYGIALILAFIGVKMFLPLVGLHIESTNSLMIVVAILVANITIILGGKDTAKVLR